MDWSWFPNKSPTYPKLYRPFQYWNLWLWGTAIFGNRHVSQTCVNPITLVFHLKSRKCKLLLIESYGILLANNGDWTSKHVWSFLGGSTSKRRMPGFPHRSNLPYVLIVVVWCYVIQRELNVFAAKPRFARGESCISFDILKSLRRDYLFTFPNKKP